MYCNELKKHYTSTVNINAPPQGCISCGTCSYPELTKDHVLTSAYVKVFRIVTRNAVNKSFWRKKDCSWPPLKQICNEYLMKFSENQSAPKLENRKTSPCSPFAPNLLHVLVSRIVGYHNLCSPGHDFSHWFMRYFIQIIPQIGWFRHGLRQKRMGVGRNDIPQGAASPHFLRSGFHAWLQSFTRDLRKE